MTGNGLRTNRRMPLPRAASASLSLLLAGALVAGSAAPFSLSASPTRAFAEETSASDGTDGAASGPTATDIDAEADEFQTQIEQSAAAYDEATARVEELEQQISENEKKISQLTSDLPEQQERAAKAARVLYKMQQDAPGLIELVLGCDNLTDFLTTFEYITHIQESNSAELDRLQLMKDSLSDTRAQLASAKAEADEQQQAAEEALAQAQAAREEAQRKAQEEAERQAAEAAAAAAEAAAKEAEAAAAAEAEESNSNAANSSSSGGTISAPSADGADWSADKTTFVSEWGARIDAYLAGSPLAGYGSTFAEAAWTYGVDPRWSPAISNTESSKGLYCFASHNAWGWGSCSWDNWEDAIYDHVAGLARGYGYTISVSAAQKYCPPNWEHWYNATSAQMELI